MRSIAKQYYRHLLFVRVEWLLASEPHRTWANYNTKTRVFSTNNTVDLWCTCELSELYSATWKTVH